MFVKAVVPALLLAIMSGPSLAQTPQAPVAASPTQPSAQQQAVLAGQNQQMVQGATLVAQMIDKGQIDQVWDGASPSAKAMISKQSFVQGVKKARATVGAVQSRTPVNVIRQRIATSNQLPPGSYINVLFTTKFARLAQPVVEEVSFHYDPDNRWRVTGYTLP